MAKKSFLSFTQTFFSPDHEYLSVVVSVLSCAPAPRAFALPLSVFVCALLSPWRSGISKRFSVSYKTTDILLRTQLKLHLQKKSLFLVVFSVNTSILDGFECFLHYLLIIWVGKNVSLNSCSCMMPIYFFPARCYIASNKHTKCTHAAAKNILFSSFFNIFSSKISCLYWYWPACGATQERVDTSITSFFLFHSDFNH